MRVGMSASLEVSPVELLIRYHEQEGRVHSATAGANPPAVRKLDSILETIVASLRKEQEQDFLSPIEFYCTAAKRIAKFGPFPSPAITAASSPKGSNVNDILRLPNLDSLKTSLLHSCTPAFPNSVLCPATQRVNPFVAPSRFPTPFPLIAPMDDMNYRQPKLPPVASGLLGIHKSMDTISIRKRKRITHSKNYGDAQPSQHCHICKFY
jgi:hypothetical protein